MSAIWFHSKNIPPFHIYHVNEPLPEFDKQFRAVFNKCEISEIKQRNLFAVPLNKLRVR